MGRPIVNAKGVKSLRNVDYTTYYAVAEIIDNSFQWSAKNAWIVLIQEEKTGGKRTSKQIKEIILADDGVGMDKEVMGLCLQYGGGENGPKSKKMGKFGMGLPNASGSQSSRTEVYSWLNRDECYFNCLDFDELEAQEEAEIPDPRKAKLPEYVKKLLPGLSEEHGTVVIWKNCDALHRKTVPAFHRNLEMFLGRVYRYWLHDEGRSIEFSAYERVGKKFKALPDFEPRKIRVMDPLFLMTPNCIQGYEKEQLNRIWAEVDKIEIEGRSYDVRIKYSIAKPETQEREGKSVKKLGHKLYRHHVGVSLLRARRELKLDEFGFISDKNDYRNRWWSCEVEFGAELDHLFRVTNDKQEARGFKLIEKEDYQELKENFEDEGLELMYAISSNLQQNINSMMVEITGRKKGSSTKTKCPQCGKVAVQGNVCTLCEFQLEFCQHHQGTQMIGGVCALCELKPIDVPDRMCTKHNVELTNGRCSECEESRTPLTEKEKRGLEMHLAEYYPRFSDSPELMKVAMEHFLGSGRSHYFVYVSTPGAVFVMPGKFGDITVIAINTRHPFFDRFMRPKIEDREEGNEIVPIHMLIGAMVNSEENDLENKNVYEEFRDSLSFNLKKLMRDYNIE